ncbi:MAG TPA: ABC transporter permease [candidate division Zixibacteria bacterium]|nr:ABC transporter permease [candidate division Zixibacteria bacterium]
MVVPALFKISVDALRANKLRSGLTLLGVVIGVTSVMTIMSALEGMAGAVAKELSSLGPSTFVIQRIGIVTSDEMFWEKIKRKPIDYKAVELIRNSCPLVDKVCPRAYNSATIKYGDDALDNVLVGGAEANYIDIVDLEVAEGRFTTFEDDLYRRPVAYVGDQIRETFFPTVDPIGKEIKIGGKKYTIIGVSKKRGSTFGNNEDNFVIIPLSTFSKQFGVPRRGLSLVIKARSVAVLDQAMDEVRVVLRSERHVPFDKDDDFDILTADVILDVLNSLTRIFRLGLIGISSISLVVGGIVVMNIMMVSVTERTREIGIRKSIGAKQKHILLQFLFESLLLTLTGGLVGIVAGFVIAKILVRMINMEIEPSMLAIIAGLSISTGTGLIFGIYPAMKAARLDPIKALSYE